MSTGGSATAIEAAGVPVKRVEELTGFPEMLDGALTMTVGLKDKTLQCCDVPVSTAAAAASNQAVKTGCPLPPLRL